jgi:type II secretory pathway pseudopilin PulG
MSCRRRSGFAIVELLVVVGLFALLASIGVVQLLRARITANEQLALTSLRSIGKACQFYFLARSQFPPTLAELGPSGPPPPYLDATLGADPATKQGYVFSYTQGAGGRSFTLLGNPQRHGTTGVRHFYMNETMAIYATDQDRDATAADTPLP